MVCLCQVWYTTGIFHGLFMPSLVYHRYISWSVYAKFGIPLVYFMVCAKFGIPLVYFMVCLCQVWYTTGIFHGLCMILNCSTFYQMNIIQRNYDNLYNKLRILICTFCLHLLKTYEHIVDYLNAD